MVGQDAQKLAQLEKAWKDAIAEADKFVKPNEFGKIVEQEGGEGMNASTFADKTVTSTPFLRTGWNSGPTWKQRAFSSP